MFLLAVGNTKTYGGGIPIVPPADCTAPVLDLCLACNISRLRALALLPQVLRGRHAAAPEVTFLRSTALHVESNEQLEVWADGELLTHTPADFTAVAHALMVV
jgi:diacylglycerol kinase (ATP)